MSDAPSSAPTSAPAPSGPASASDSQLTGRFAEERNAGYKPMPERPKPQRTEREFATGREAADELAKKRRGQGHAGSEVRPAQYEDGNGKRIDDRQTVTLERAADDLKTSRISDASGKELEDRHQLALDVDALRAKAGVPTDPTAPVDPTQIDPHLFGDLPRQAPQIEPAHLPPDLQPAPPGVDPDLHRAFQDPKVRAAVEKEVNTSHETARTAQAHYAENVVAAQEIALGSVYAAFPEMVGVKTQPQMQEVLNRLQQTNPQRFQQAQAMLQNFARLHGERQNMERQKQQFERQNFQRDSAVQDAAYAKALANVPAAQRESVAREAISYAASLGIDERTLTHLLNTNPIMRHSAFRKMMFDAAAGSLARKQLATQRQQNRAAVPPVSRPGHSNGGGVRAAQNANLQQLSAKLTQSGDAKDAAALLMAMRSQRRR
jgi:hypothetical protein